MRVEDEEKVKEAKKKEKEEALKLAKAAPGASKAAAIVDIEEGKDGKEEETTTGMNRAINTLMNINMTIERGQLVCIVGSVGSGKSSLLASLLGDLYIDKTAEGAGVAVKGSVAYHSQGKDHR